VVFDKDSARQTSKKVYTSCKRDNIPSLCRKKSGLLHYKSAIIDSTLILGSANWTGAAFKVNDDFVLCIDPLTEELEHWVKEWWSVVEKQAI
jgi:phosphatidylserine/phosphatidylglycerophosphate/cardiolipin synthase-like enzyme